MKHLRFLTALILTLFVSVTSAWAQDNDWDERLDTALNAPYPNDQIVALEELYNTETDYQNKLVSAYWVAVIAKDLKRYSLAAEYGEAALELSDKHSKGNLQQRDAIVAQLVEIYFRDEKSTKAVDVIDANLALNDAMIEDIWAETETGLIHRYSGLECPNRIGDLYREKTHNFHPTGIDVGCSYKEYNGEDNTVTLYLTQEPNDGDTRTAHEKAMAAVLMNWGDGDRLVDTQILETKTGSGTDITESLIRIGSIQKGYRYTGTWTSDLAGWTLKSRITWDGVLKQGFGRQHAETLLSSPTKTVLSHLGGCQKNKTAELTSNKLDNDGILALSALSLMALEEDKAERPNLACLEHTSQEGNLVIESYLDSAARPYSLVGDAIEGDIYLYPASSLSIMNRSGAPAYVLRQDDVTEEEKSITRVLAVYEGKPSPLTVISDFAKIYSGEMKTLGSVVRDGNGDTSINIVSEAENEN